MMPNFRAFLDLLFNALLVFVFLFIVSYMLVDVEKQKANITTKAEFVITVTWALGNPDDVDSWLRDPTGNIIWFNHKERGLMNLDRDDRGSATDTFTLPNGTQVKYLHNQEIVTIRGFIPGTWVFNVHMYKKRCPIETLVEIKMEKMNPTVETVFLKTVKLSDKEEVTVARFKMLASGRIGKVDDVQVPLALNELIDAGLREEGDRPGGIGP